MIPKVRRLEPNRLIFDINFILLFVFVREANLVPPLGITPDYNVNTLVTSF